MAALTEESVEIVGQVTTLSAMFLFLWVSADLFVLRFHHRAQSLCVDARNACSGKASKDGLQFFIDVFVQTEKPAVSQDPRVSHQGFEH